MCNMKRVHFFRERDKLIIVETGFVSNYGGMLCHHQENLSQNKINRGHKEVSFISSSAFKVSADGRMTASAGKIANWEIVGDHLQRLNSSDKGIILDAVVALRNFFECSSSTCTFT